MQGDDFVGHLPSNPQWSLDGQTLYFDWNPEKAQNDSLPTPFPVVVEFLTRIGP